MDKKGTMSFDAPNDPLDPVFITKKGPMEKSAARREDSDDSDGDEMMRGSSLALRTKSNSRMVEKIPGDKRVSMHSTQLKRALIELFQRKDEYRLNEMVDILDHPV